MKKFHKHIFFLILFFQYFVSNSQNTVYQIDITKEIGSTTWRYLEPVYTKPKNKMQKPSYYG